MTVPSDQMPNILAGLSPSQSRLIVEVAEALRVPVERDLNKDSDLCANSAFAEDFQNRLVLYHALNEDVLKKKTFEFALVRAARAAGKTARVIMNSVNPGEDAVIDRIKYSLKTEAADQIHETRIKISKLMEARWIRECQDGNDFARGVVSRIVPHLEQYQRILILRAFRRSESIYEYRLLEIPKDLLLLIRKLKTSDFTPRTANGSSRATVTRDGRPVFNLRLDGSVEKITVEGLLEAECIKHGSWKIPIRITPQSPEVR